MIHLLSYNFHIEVNVVKFIHLMKNLLLIINIYQLVDFICDFVSICYLVFGRYKSKININNIYDLIIIRIKFEKKTFRYVISTVIT